MKKYVFYFLFLLFLGGCERITDYSDDNSLPPSTPKDFAVYSAHDGLVIIRWTLNTENNISGYNIYRSVNDTVNFTYLNFVSDLNYYYDDSLSYDKTYYYKISAVSLQNKESALSYHIKAIPINKYAPDVPVNLKVYGCNWAGGKPCFKLQWQSNSEGDLAGYKIYRSASPDFAADTLHYIGQSNTTDYADSSLDFGYYSNYYYKITAFDKGNLSSNAGPVATDVILESPKLVFPGNNSVVASIENFTITTANYPCTYKIFLLANPITDEIWSKSANSNSSSGGNMDIYFDYYGLFRGTYYIRIASYTVDENTPNSISEVYKFTINY